MTAMDFMMRSKLGAMTADEATVLGHRLLTSFHRLRLRRHREQIIALAERLAEEEEKYPEGSGG